MQRGLAWLCDSDSEESHTGLDVFHLGVSKNHRPCPPIDVWWSDQRDTDLMPFRIQIQNLKLMVRRGYPIPWSQLAQEQSMMLLKALPWLWQSTALRQDASSPRPTVSGPEPESHLTHLCRPKTHKTGGETFSTPRALSDRSRIHEYHSIIRCALWSSACKTRTSCPSEATNTLVASEPTRYEWNGCWKLRGWQNLRNTRDGANACWHTVSTCTSWRPCLRVSILHIQMPSWTAHCFFRIKLLETRKPKNWVYQTWYDPWMKAVDMLIKIAEQISPSPSAGHQRAKVK